MSILVTVLALPACSEPTPDSGGAATVRDSSGVRIVELRTWEDAAPLLGTLDSLVLSVGSLDGADGVELSDVTAVRAGTNGRVYVAEGRAGRIRVFGLDGRLESTLGGAGDGPGEHRYLTSFEVLPGDTVVTWDGRLGRLQRFGPDGSRVDGLRPSEGIVDRAFRTADGTLFTVGRVPQPLPSAGSGWRVRRDTLAVVRSRPNGPPDTLGRYPGPERIQRIVVGADGSVATQMLERPFARDFVVAADPEGLWFGSTDAFRLARVKGSDGIVMELRRVPGARPLTVEDAESLREREMAAASSAAARRLVQTRFDADRLPETRPAFAGLVASGSGELWVEAYRPDRRKPHRWDVFGPDGELRGTVEAPAGFQLQAVRGRRAYGTVRTELGVPYVQVRLMVLRRAEGG